MLNRLFSRRRSGRRGVPAAIALITAAVLGLSGCSLLPDSWQVTFGQAEKYTAYFDRAPGLYAGNDIAILGMPVGRVLSITPEATRVKVEFSVDDDITLPKDVTAAIVNTSIVTTRHIELTPVYQGGEKLSPGGTVTDTKAPVELDTLFDSIDSLVENLSGDAPGEGPLADFVDISSGIADGNGQRMKDALAALAAAGRTTADNGDALAQIIKATSSLTTALTDNYPKMLSFSNSITRVAEMLGDQAPGLDATLANVNTTLANTAEFLQANSGTLGDATGRLSSLIENLSDYSRQVVETIDLGPLLFQNLTNSVSAEQGAWRAQVLLDKSLLDNEMVNRFCEAINLQKNGCRTGQLADFGPDLGVYSSLLRLMEK
ncbi:MlaD family protein [Gordonia sp. VNK21]|uniref:MlaD family protein n=1 Tax=Gordonia sp. VNK21 TaxID=3382483 RepID=UPI0038D4EA98